jgi:two-component system, OmpR family, KDP operon response regulator KdpE
MSLPTRSNTTGPHVLVVDDEPEIRRLLHAVLAEAGYSVDLAASGEEALQKVGRVEPAAVVLDITLPDMSGLDLCRELRKWSAAPVLVVSAMTDERTKVQAFDLGADHYLTKPFAIDEFLARLHAALRRAPSESASAVLVAGELRLNQVSGQVLRGAQELRLTPTEHQLLQYLMANAGRVIPYSELIRAVWGMHGGENLATLRVFIAQLRRKIEPDADAPTYLHTVPRIGYRFGSER